MTSSDGASADRGSTRRIVRRATYFSIGFILAAIVVAALGSALIAWLLSVTGMPFRPTWLALTVLVLVVPAVGLLVSEVRSGSRNRREREPQR